MENIETGKTYSYSGVSVGGKVGQTFQVTEIRPSGQIIGRRFIKTRRTFSGTEYELGWLRGPLARPADLARWVEVPNPITEVVECPCGYANDMRRRDAYEMTLCAKCGETLPGVTEAERSAAYSAAVAELNAAQAAASRREEAVELAARPEGAATQHLGNPAVTVAGMRAASARPVVHRMIGSSDVRCGAPMRDPQHPDGWDLGTSTVSPRYVTCEACLAQAGRPYPR